MGVSYKKTKRISSSTRLDLSLPSPGFNVGAEIREPLVLLLPYKGGMERVEAKRAVPRAQNTRLNNDATTELRNNAAKVVSLQSLINRLTLSASEVEAVNRALEEFIPVEDVESEYTTTLRYQEASINALSFIRESMIV